MALRYPLSLVAVAVALGIGSANGCGVGIVERELEDALPELPREPDDEISADAGRRRRDGGATRTDAGGLADGGTRVDAGTRADGGVSRDAGSGPGASNVEEAIAYGLALVGTPYGWWTGGGIPEGPPMWARNAPAPSVEAVKAASANCAGLTNLMLRKIGKSIPGAGGTGAYSAYFRSVAVPFDATVRYPAGTLLGRHYRDVHDQGHVAVVLSNGYVLQSYATSFGGTTPGVNANVTVSQSHGGYYYEYAVLPQHWLH